MNQSKRLGELQANDLRHQVHALTDINTFKGPDDLPVLIRDKGSDVFDDAGAVSHDH